MTKKKDKRNPLVYLLGGLVILGILISQGIIPLGTYGVADWDDMCIFYEATPSVGSYPVTVQPGETKCFDFTINPNNLRLPQHSLIKIEPVPDEPYMRNGKPFYSISMVIDGKTGVAEFDADISHIETNYSTRKICNEWVYLPGLGGTVCKEGAWTILESQRDYEVFDAMVSDLVPIGCEGRSGGFMADRGYEVGVPVGCTYCCGENQIVITNTWETPIVIEKMTVGLEALDDTQCGLQGGTIPLWSDRLGYGASEGWCTAKRYVAQLDESINAVWSAYPTGMVGDLPEGECTDFDCPTIPPTTTTTTITDVCPKGEIPIAGTCLSEALIIIGILSLIIGGAYWYYQRK